MREEITKIINELEWIKSAINQHQEHNNVDYVNGNSVKEYLDISIKMCIDLLRNIEEK